MPISLYINENLGRWFTCDFTSGIMPNVETKVLLIQIFGEKSHPMRKYQRILYWFPKFKHLNPFPVPQELPADPVDLARFSLTRIANDLDAEVTVYQVPPSYSASFISLCSC